jgi:enediyne biosynthesis thioesterase
MGSIREYSATSIFKEIYVRAEQDSWGMATNYSRLEVFGDVNPGEVVEAKLWTEKSSGVYDELLNIQFEWAVTNYQGEHVIVARSQMGFSWLKILGYGVAKAEPLPKFLKDFFDGMMPKTKYSKPLQGPTKQYKNLNIGEVVYENKDYLKDKSTIFSHEIITTSENSNFIGNIYFANYAEWLGHVRDQYLYRITPKYTTNLGKDGEWICLNCSIEHLSEAMPYDMILVNMSIKAVYASGLDLFFNYYLVENGSIKRKLAYASHKIISVKRDGVGNLTALKLPNNVLEKLLKNGSIKS